MKLANVAFYRASDAEKPCIDCLARHVRESLQKRQTTGDNDANLMKLNHDVINSAFTQDFTLQPVFFIIKSDIVQVLKICQV